MNARLLFAFTFVGIGLLVGCSSSHSLSLANEVSQSGGGFLGSVEEIEQFRRLLTPFLRERVSGTEGNLRVQEHIRRELSDLGWRLTEDRFAADTPLGAKQFTNIVADLNPLSTSRVALACHFDSKLFEEFAFIGATDSAVPCALLLDLARNLNESLWRSVEDGASTSLQLIFFDGEEAFLEWSDEDSLYGSRHLAEKMEAWQIPTDEAPGSTPVIKTMSVLILLDLVGTVNCQFRNWFPRTSHLYLKLQDIEKRLFGAGLLDTLGRSSAEFERARYFPDETIPKMMRSGIADDHVPFMARNVSILHLISYPFPNVWHKASDDEEALSYPAINNLARILRVFTVEHLGLPLL